MDLLVVDPACELVEALGVGLARELQDLGNRLVDGRGVLEHLVDAGVIVIDSARNLAVRPGGRLGDREQNGRRDTGGNGCQQCGSSHDWTPG